MSKNTNPTNNFNNAANKQNKSWKEILANNLTAPTPINAKKSKALAGQMQEMSDINAKSDGQQQLLDMFKTPSKSMFLIDGSAGTGKTFIPLFKGLEMLKKQKIEGLFICHPGIETGQSIGLLPGTAEEKLAPFFANIYNNLCTLQDKSWVNNALDSNIIQFLSLQHMRGHTFHNVFAFLDEAQNATKEQIDMISTRAGEDTTICLSGDSQSQVDTRQTEQNYFGQLVKFINEDKSNNDLIGTYQFTPEDVVRSPIAKRMAQIQEKMKKQPTSP